MEKVYGAVTVVCAGNVAKEGSIRRFERRNTIYYNPNVGGCLRCLVCDFQTTLFGYSNLYFGNWDAMGIAAPFYNPSYLSLTYRCLKKLGS